jgi:cytochrome P450
LETAIEAHAEEELAPLIRNGGGNICTTFGAKFSALVETEWLNLEKQLAPVLATTAAAWVNAWREMDPQRVNEFSAKLYDIAKDLLASRRKSARDPEEDPASSLLLERNGAGQPLDDEHLV